MRQKCVNTCIVKPASPDIVLGDAVHLLDRLWNGSSGLTETCVFVDYAAHVSPDSVKREQYDSKFYDLMPTWIQTGGFGIDDRRDSPLRSAIEQSGKLSRIISYYRCQNRSFPAAHGPRVVYEPQIDTTHRSGRAPAKWQVAAPLLWVSCRMASAGNPVPPFTVP
ncbi:MAG: hypothetical protein BAA04_00785 [Firmicutes bacterium ZCTH02-B6]|nr:MAG: hypothetical protein BAA04_00785 [Firmicutes bacterium ZCTH02-B6]